MAAFCFCLYITSLSFADGFSSPEQMHHSAWFSILLAGYGIFFIHTSRDDERTEFFGALGLRRPYLFTQLLSMLLIVIPIPVFWFFVGIIQNESLSGMAVQFGLMALFSVNLLASAMLARMLILPYRLSKMLYVLISGPSVLIAWIIAHGSSLPSRMPGMAWWTVCSLLLATGWILWLLWGTDRKE